MSFKLHQIFTHRLRHWLALTLILVLTACKGQTNMVPAPQTYFTGKQLELAKLVDTADAEAVSRYAMSMSSEEIDEFGKEKMTVLVYAGRKSAVRPEALPTVSALVKAGANPQREGYKDASLLAAAVGNASLNHDLALLRAILEGGLNPDAASYAVESSPLLIQLSNQDGLSAIKLLVEHGADVNIRDSGGDTPLSSTMMTLGLAEAEYLLDKGADPVMAVNYYGVSFAHLLDHKIKNLQTLKDPRLPRALAIRDRIIKMGVAWPPESPEQFRARYVAQYKQKTGKTFVFMPDEGWQQFFPQYTPAPVRKVPLAPR